MCRTVSRVTYRRVCGSVFIVRRVVVILLQTSTQDYDTHFERRFQCMITRCVIDV